MKWVAGLGNRGIEYQLTRHNLGFLAIDRIAERCGTVVENRHCRSLTGRARIADQEVLLAKPETYMNLSGLAVRELLQEYEADPQRDLVLIYDELDLPMGTLRIRERGSSAGHKGVQSVIGVLGTQEILRIRLGVAPDYEVRDGARYALSQLKKKQLPLVDETLDQAAEALELILRDGPAAAMNRFNRRPDEAPAKES